MSYERLAYVYDTLMANVPYEKWLHFFKEEKQRHQVHGNRVLDLACGTGEMSVQLAKEGLTVTGVDLSSDMLMVAQEKAEQAKVTINLFQQDMSALEGLDTFDVITVFCDSLNYLQTPEDTKNTFSHAHRHLDENGLFLFDVHSTYQMDYRYVNETFTLNEEKIAYIWDSFVGEHEYSVEHELSFFVLEEESGLYERFEELHKQRTYSINDYTLWLDEAGFTVLSVTADFTNQPPTETSERIFFTCKKKSESAR
ncbi:class I SAM-dependent DNA methyltransferase [Lederbergia lenta]|uniref:Type 12 methyltransferase n=1 Tax=Lederbergia lenta TaxID=1467 RepID=A0A2X4VUZ7_LEDLE|nr:class I SAM-dependent methyltransferase [Lederbergia lenta]MEC2325262.1 class I SAM-dependent methyltransferase [Lederbergia lenta]SQI55876.1 type 12 methyltransferase [Lederbergia lenta]